MKLAEWLDLPNPDGSRKSRGDFARKIGVTPQMISAYCDKENPTFPKPPRLLKIERVTKGAVTALDFLRGVSP